MSKIVVSEFMEEDILRAGLGHARIVYDPGLVDAPERLAAEIADADALILRNRTQLRGDLLARAVRLRAVGRLGVGLDNIDMEACRARGIAVFPASGANDVAVAEYVVATSMLLLRGAYGATPAMAQGQWPRNALSNGREIFGLRLGLVGFGSIAREVARRALALGMEVTAHDPFLAADDPAWRAFAGPVTPLSLSDLLGGSDVVSLHVPLSAQTKGLIGEAALAAMKDDAVLINAARGGVVDEAALADALRTGRLGGAALDVFETEPLVQDTAGRFGNIANLILTPHIAGLSAQANRRVSQVTVEAVRRHLEG